MDPPIAKLGTSREMPLKLLTAYHARPGEPVWLSSETTLRLQPLGYKSHYTVNALYFNTARLTKIGPTPLEYAIVHYGPAPPAFKEGWNRLPTELKLQILRYIVVSEHAIAPPIVIRSWKRLPTGKDRRCLDHVLSMTPEIARLSRDLYYKENTFLMGELTSFPKPEIGSLIRAVEFELIRYDPTIYADSGQCRGWPELLRLAGGAGGMVNLRHIHVDLRLIVFDRRAHANNTIAVDTMFPGACVFQCHGRLLIQADPGGVEDEKDTDGVTLRDAIQKKIGFAA